MGSRWDESIRSREGWQVKLLRKLVILCLLPEILCAAQSACISVTRGRFSTQHAQLTVCQTQKTDRQTDTETTLRATSVRLCTACKRWGLIKYLWRFHHHFQAFSVGNNVSKLRGPDNRRSRPHHDFNVVISLRWTQIAYRFNSSSVQIVVPLSRLCDN